MSSVFYKNNWIVIFSIIIIIIMPSIIMLVSV